MNFKTYGEMIKALLDGHTIIDLNSPAYPHYKKLIAGQVYGKIPALFGDRDWAPEPAPSSYFCWSITHETP